MTTIQAVYENGVFRPTTPIELPESCQVEITFRSTVAGQASVPSDRRPLSRLAEIAKDSPENPSLPCDLAAQHDHYLYGLPKHQ